MLLAKLPSHPPNSLIESHMHKTMSSLPSEPLLRSSPKPEDFDSYELSRSSIITNYNDNDNDDNDDHHSDNDEFDRFDDLEASSPTHGLLGPRSRRKTLCSSSRKCASCGSQVRLFYRRTAGVRHRCAQLGFMIFAVVGCLVLFTLIFNPSYTHDLYPENYSAITDSVRNGGGRNPHGFWRKTALQKTTVAGRGNPNRAKVYIAANIIDARLVAGAWGDAVLELMDLLGEENVFLSIFENDSGPSTHAALKDLDHTITTRMPGAGHAIVSTTVTLKSIPRVKLPSGETYIKRITYLAELRNRAMLPLLGSIPSLKRWNQSKPIKRATSEWETEPDFILDPLLAPKMPDQWVEDPHAFTRVLFLNDVVFDPVQALHLLFSTNKGVYTAACGLDFINPFKYYDTFATRDIDGYNIGVPFFPFFAPGNSRPYVEAGSDAVPVKSCWGGITAFDAKVFLKDSHATTTQNVINDNDETHQSTNFTHPVLFRSEKAPFWDASECCLIHADIADPNNTFVNPFVRVAYDESTFMWLPIIKRIERLFRGPHLLIAKVLGMPWGGEKRMDSGAGYCGSRKLLVMRESEPGVRPVDGRQWEGLPVP